MGMIAHPLDGLWKTAQKPWAKKQEPQQLAIRIERGRLAFEASTTEERQVVIDTLKRLTKRAATMERKKTMEAEAQELLKADKSRKLTLEDKDSDDEKVSPEFAEPEVHRSSSPDPVAPAEQKSNEPPSLPPRRSPQLDIDQEEAAFQRDLELAKQLSLVEQNHEHDSGGAARTHD